MNNASGRPERRTLVLRPMDPDQARYHCERLRALADLIDAGEPVSWIDWTTGIGAEEQAHLTIAVDRGRLKDAEIAVRVRVAAGDEGYAIKVSPRAPTVTRRPGR